MEIGPTTLKTIKNLHHILMLVNNSFVKYVVKYLQGGIVGPDDFFLDKRDDKPNFMSPMIKKITSELSAQIQKPILQIFESCH